MWGLRQYYKKILDIIDHQTKMIAFHGFLNEEGTEMTSIQINPNTASTEYHMKVLKENWDGSFSQYTQMVEGTTIDYYGDPPECALAMNEQSKQVLTVCPVHITEFTHISKDQAYMVYRKLIFDVGGQNRIVGENARPTKPAADGGESARLSSIFLRPSIFLLSGICLPPAPVRS